MPVIVASFEVTVQNDGDEQIEEEQGDHDQISAKEEVGAVKITAADWF